MWLGFGQLPRVVDVLKDRRRNPNPNSNDERASLVPETEKLKYTSASFAVLSESFVELLIDADVKNPISLEHAAEQLVELPLDHANYAKRIKCR